MEYINHRVIGYDWESVLAIAAFLMNTYETHINRVKSIISAGHNDLELTFITHPSYRDYLQLSVWVI